MFVTKLEYKMVTQAVVERGIQLLERLGEWWWIGQDTCTCRK